MQRAALYARVSTDAQKQEGMIESQIAELRRQIAAAGHVLVKEYIDDGYTGSRMDRPALQELRRDLKGDVFDVIYFLAADRIARAVIYQTIIIGEMLLHKKEIVINGQQYIDKSENKFTMTVLDAVAELERAKITERMTRGKLHRLRQGVMASGGVAPFGALAKRAPRAGARRAGGGGGALDVRDLCRGRHLALARDIARTAWRAHAVRQGAVGLCANPRHDEQSGLCRHALFQPQNGSERRSAAKAGQDDPARSLGVDRHCRAAACERGAVRSRAGTPRREPPALCATSSNTMRSSSSAAGTPRWRRTSWKARCSR